MNYNGLNLSEVNAQTFVQVINSDRATQCEKFGAWMSPKAGGKELISKAEKRLKAYKVWCSYLEQVINLNPNDIDVQLNIGNITSTLKGLSPEMRNELLGKLND